jgi:hypothetical protein
MIQLTRNGTIFSGSAKNLDALRKEFNQYHCVKLPGFLQPELLQLIQHQVARAEFYQKTHTGIKVELSTTHDVVVKLMHLLMNDPELFQAIEQISGCGPIGCFTGRVYRMLPGQGHYDSWHDDMAEDRITAMSINLSTEIYSGGRLQIRDKNSQLCLKEVTNVGFGDGILFSLSHYLQHRVTEVEGTVSKTALAGWFRSRPDFRSALKREAPVFAM